MSFTSEISQRLAYKGGCIMDKFCSNCANPLEDTAKFCNRCGKAVNISEPIQPHPAQAPIQIQVQQTQNSVDIMSSKKPMTDYTRLRIVLAAVCAVLIIIGIVFIPGNIRKRTSGSSDSSSQSTTQSQSSTPDSAAEEG